MIPNDTLQAAIVSMLKANTALVAELANSNQVKESQYQGDDYSFPAVRVRLGTQTPYAANPTCGIGTLPFAVLVFSEQKSSQQCDHIAGVVSTEFHGKNVQSGGVLFNKINTTGLVSAIRTGENLWLSEVQFTAMIQTS